MMPNHGITRVESGIVLLILGALVFLLIPRPVAIWDGEFALTIRVTEQQPIDRASLKFAYCWTEKDANLALQDLDSPNVGYRQHEPFANGDYVIYLPASGRIEGKTINTYNHPRFLIVEYKFREDTDKETKRKKFVIPSGRGPRRLSIELP